MQVENEKSWQPVGLSQNRTLPVASAFLRPYQPQGWRRSCSLCTPHTPLPSITGSGPLLSTTQASLAAGLQQAVRGPCPAASETVHFCLESGVSPSPMRSRPTGESRGCWGRPPEAASPPHTAPQKKKPGLHMAPSQPWQPHADLWTFYLYNSLVSLSLFLYNCPRASWPLMRLLVNHHLETTNDLQESATLPTAASPFSGDFYTVWFCCHGGLLFIFDVEGCAPFPHLSVLLSCFF